MIYKYTLLLFLLSSVSLKAANKFSFDFELVNDSIRVGDRIIGKMKLKNLTVNDTISVLEPSAELNSINLKLLHNGNEIAEQTHLLAAFLPRKVSILPNDSMELTLNISFFYPFIFESGNYQLDLEYFYEKLDGKSMKSTSVFNVAEPNDYEISASEDYIKVLRGGTNPSNVDFGLAYLSKYSNTNFAIEVRFLMARTYRKLKKFEDSLMMYDTILIDPRSYAEDVNEAVWEKINTYEAKGDYQKALNTIDDLNNDLMDNIQIDSRKRQLQRKMK